MTTQVKGHEMQMDIGEIEKSAEDAAGLLAVMANSNRLMILCHLMNGEMAVQPLADAVGMTQSALSQHLKVLREDGLVTTRRESQTVYYRVMPGPAMDVIRVLHEHFCSVPEATSANVTRLLS